MSIYVLGISRDNDVRSLESQIPHQAALSGKSQGIVCQRVEKCPDFRAPVQSKDGAVLLRGSEVRRPTWVFSESLAAVVAHPTHSPLSPDAHARIVTAIHQQICILPIRYGTVLHEEEAVRTMLRARRRDLIASLDQIGGSCELGVRIVLAHQTVPEPKSHHVTGSATDYLSWRRARYEREDALSKRADQVTRKLVEATDGLYRQWRRLASSSPDLLRLSFLVERDCVVAFRNRVRTTDLTISGDKCAVLGPWPPFSFV